MSYKPGGMTGGIKPTLVGLASGAMFAVSAVGYRGAILNVSAGHFVMAATFTLACGLVLQAALLTTYLALRDRPVLVAIAAQWRRSLFAGFMGAFASQFWFLAFAIATAASVRTLALVEVLFAQAISAFIFKQKTSVREGLGMGLIVAGVILLIWSHPT
jgi:drug/metabolite transporter (DMT)-like permease